MKLEWFPTRRDRLAIVGQALLVATICAAPIIAVAWFFLA